MENPATSIKKLSKKIMKNICVKIAIKMPPGGHFQRWVARRLEERVGCTKATQLQETYLKQQNYLT